MSEGKTRQDGLGRDPGGSSSQASPEAALHLRPAGFDLSRMQWRPIETAPKDVRIIVYINDPSGRAISFGRVHGFVADGEPYMSIDGFGGGWRVTHWLPAPTAPAIEARRAENAVAGSVEDESAVAEGQAPVNHVLLSALKAMDKALTDNWVFPSDEVTRDMIGEETCKAWIQIRSAISKADRE